jgi:streptogramin lyase
LNKSPVYLQHVTYPTPQGLSPCGMGPAACGNIVIGNLYYEFFSAISPITGSLKNSPW